MRRKRWRWLLLVLLMLLIAAGIQWLRRPVYQLPQRGPVVRLWLHTEKRTVEIPLERYVVGVVLAEMPISFEMEALKAQAVGARTYTVRRLATGEAEHPQGAVLCDNPNHCQAYLDPAVAARNGRNGAWKVRRAAAAVWTSSGEILRYRGEPVDPVYHSTCGGRTAPASEAWGHAVSYLVSVPCRCTEVSPHSRTGVVVNLSEIAARLGIKHRIRKIRIIERTSTGRVKWLMVGQTRVSGERFRAAMNLPSRSITVIVSGKQARIVTRGYGHGVGMCQYGAQAMAKAGKLHREILSHYYPGTRLDRLRYNE